MNTALRGLLALLLYTAVAGAGEIQADPSDYQDKINALKPGDTLLLAPGDYVDHINIRDLFGTEDNWITIRGPATGPKARILGDPAQCCNTIEIRTGAYVALENLLIDGQDIDGIFAISAAGSNTHHIRIEGCHIVGHGAHQQTVGISTKTTTWGWIVRGNIIEAAGTGIYFGNSNGAAPFIGGLIEYNLFLDSKGYNMQIKHQNNRGDIEGMPTTPQKTIIRHNVFIKGDLVNEDGARPNLLVGGFPDSGPGAEDIYEIYGNFFYDNQRESHIQATGRVWIHDNVFVDTAWQAVYLTDHQGKTIKIAHVYNNTFYDCDSAIDFADSAREEHSAFGNLMLCDVGLEGNFSNAGDNLRFDVADAGQVVVNPSLTLGAMNFYPLVGQAEGTAIDLGAYVDNADYDRDFNGDSKGARTFRGAYAGNALNPGWQLDAAIKGEVATDPVDTTAPTGTVTVAGGNATTNSLTVGLSLAATDGDSGMGAGAMMRFSNDGATWSPAEPYAASRAGWQLDAFGGDATEGTKTVHAQFRDVAGNWSASATDEIAFQADGEPPPPPPATDVVVTTTSGCSLGNGTPGGFFAPFLLALPFFLRRRRQLAAR